MEDIMERILWTENFSVGVARLDDQHKRLVQMINRLIAEPRLTTESETISSLLSEMTSYARKHFSAEEELLRRHHYPRLEEQVAEHQAFQKKTTDFCSATMLHVRVVPETLLHYLSDWLVHHILKTDMAYKPFFREQGIH